MITKNNLREAITSARVRFVTDHPFWAMVGLRIPLTEDKQVPTASTDGITIGYNPDWILEQINDSPSPSSVIQFIIAHEIYHILFQTHERCGGRNGVLWNIASDYIINRDLREEFSAYPKGILYSEDFDDPDTWYTERVYDHLYKNAKKIDQKTYSIQLPGGKTVTVSEWDDVMARPMYPGKTPSEKSSKHEDWKAIAVKAHQVSKMAGTSHGYLDRLVDSILAPKLPWRALLADFVAVFAQDDYSYDRLDPTYMQSDILMPSLYNMTLTGVIAIDTSGSISIDEATEFVSEVAGIIGAFPNADLTVLFIDTEVHNAQTIRSLAELDVQKGFAEGGGGTDFRPVFEYIDRNGLSPAFLTYLTDGYGSYPEKAPGYTTMWIINNNSYPDDQVPFGRVIRMVD